MLTVFASNLTLSDVTSRELTKFSNAFDNIFNQGDNRFKFKPVYTVGERNKIDNLNVNDKLLIALDYQVNDKILINGFIAQHGMAIMSERKGLEFESNIESDSTNLNFLVKDLLDEFGDKIKLFRDPTRGGLGTVLHEIANDIELGVFIKEVHIPIEKQVAAACEMLGLDPMYVANEGVFITIVDPSVENEVLALMRNHEKGKNASIIGEITDAHPNKVVLKSLIGGKRIVSPLVGEQLPRIC